MAQNPKNLENSMGNGRISTARGLEPPERWRYAHSPCYFRDFWDFEPWNHPRAHGMDTKAQRKVTEDSGRPSRRIQNHRSGVSRPLEVEILSSLLLFRDFLGF